MASIIDFHSHILPRIDDGSASVEESIAMLEAEAKQGIRYVVATPHFYPNHDSPEQFLKKRARAVAMLRQAAEGREDLPRLFVGAEVYYYRGISDSDFLPHLTICGTKSILIEMPFGPWTDSMYQELENIRLRRGITPIIAHIDRYIAPFRTHHIPERLAELPVLVQANAEFFTAKSTSRMALRMLRNGNIQLLGSDCHNMRSRSPNLGSAVSLIRERLGSDAIAYINQNQHAVLDR